MSNVRGRIAVDVQFTDSTTSSDEQSLKTITLQDATEYTSGKVAIVTGTVGTASVFLSLGSIEYRDASGSLVGFVGIQRLAAKASRDVAITGDAGMRVPVTDSFAAVAGIDPGVIDGISVTPYYTSGTASYTLVLYGS